MEYTGPPVHEFKVGWISAIPIELTAAMAMLDRTYKSSAETAQYRLGSILNHNVVLACLPAGQIGTNAAATVIADMSSKFPNLEFCLMVGVGAGVPSIESDIRLGDVVISQPQGSYGGVVQYDFGKTNPGYNKTTGSLNSPPPILLTAVSQVRANLHSNLSHISKHLSSLASLTAFNRGNAGPDILYRPSYLHVDGPTCNCCTKDMTVPRIPREREEVVIHYGTIASGNQVMKDGSTRDALSAKLGGVLCFEMEAAGLMNYFPTLVIRGICDYADSHKNKNWQPAAAAAAAACAKEILRFVPAQINAFTYQLPDNKIKESDPIVYARSALGSQERQEYLKILKFDQIDARHATIKPAYAYTCRWLLNRHEYQDWLNAGKILEHGGFLWIKGKPGSGKSTMMKFAYADAKQKLAETTVLSFFFNARGDELEKTAIGMYRSLLCQLLESHRELQVVLDPLASRNTVSFIHEIETLKGLFKQAMEHFGRRSLTCFIDALDECNEDQVREMISFFEQLESTGVQNQYLLRVCLSSRHYPHITLAKGIELILERQQEHGHDIAYYLQSELRVGDDPLVKDIKEEILKRAAGVFLWVALVVKILNKEYDRGRIHKLKMRLTQIPNGLNELFRDILMRDGENTGELIICIQWTLFARRPLSREELYFAIVTGVEPEELNNWHLIRVTANDMERYILSSSKGLVELTKSSKPTVQFIHESVRDYLLSGNGLEWLRSDLMRNFPGFSHERLKQCCRNYIRMFFNEHRTLTRFLPGKYILLPYAMLHILYHADAAGGYGVSQHSFVENFPFKILDRLERLFKGHSHDRYSAEASLLYIFIVENCPNLVRVELDRVSHMDILGEEHKYPLFAAIYLGRAKVVRALLKPNVEARSKLQVSGDQWNAVVNSVIGNSKRYHLGGDRTLFLQAVSRGDFPLVNVLLATSKVDVNSRNKYGQTILSCAAEGGHVEIVRLLLALDLLVTCEKVSTKETSPLELNSKDKYERTPLFWAVLSRNEELVQLLLDCPGVQVDSLDKEDQTPLHIAIIWGYTAMASTLLAHSRVNIDSRNQFGQTPLSLAAKKGNVEIVELLLAHPSVNVNSQDTIGRTPLCIAVKEGHGSVVTLLLGRPDVEVETKDAFGRPPMFYSIQPAMTELLKKRLPASYLEK